MATLTTMSSEWVGGPNWGSVFKGHTDQVTDAVLSSDGKQIASGGRDGSVRIWNLYFAVSVPERRPNASPLALQ